MTQRLTMVTIPQGFHSTSDMPSPASLMDHAPSLLVYLKRMGISEHDAEDVVQETLLKGLLMLGTQEIRNWRAWLKTVAKHIVFTKSRQPKLVELGDSTAPLITPINEFERLEEQDVELAAMKAAIKRLPTKLQQFIVHCDLKGNSVRAAARTFNMPASTARRQYLEALHQVRTDLLSQGFDMPHLPTKQKYVRKCKHRASKSHDTNVTHCAPASSMVSQSRQSSSKKEWPAKDL